MEITSAVTPNVRLVKAIQVEGSHICLDFSKIKYFYRCKIMFDFLVFRVPSQVNNKLLSESASPSNPWPAGNSQGLDGSDGPVRCECLQPLLLRELYGPLPACLTQNATA